MLGLDIRRLVPWAAIFGLVGCGGESLAPSDAGSDANVASLCTPNAVVSCYSGIPETRDVGICHGGTRTCNAEGTGYLANCSGEVLPMEETCGNGLDDDCDGTTDTVPDLDGDGFTRCDGDCCEDGAECGTPAAINPAAVEIVTPDGAIVFDDDCDGMVDEVEPACDTGLSLDDADASHAGAALDVCSTVGVDGARFGLVSARYTQADGTPLTTPLQHGLTSAFGTNVTPRQGERLLVLSTGRARDADDVDACGTSSCSNHGGTALPAGCPISSNACTANLSSAAADDVALELTLKAPSNAVGFSIDVAFYTFEYPSYVCASYADQFVALVNPSPSGAVSGNIVFDTQTTPLSANFASIDYCSTCTLGTTALAGTGFDNWSPAGATMWLRGSAPVQAGSEFVLRLMLWDSGDATLDSTVLVDGFRWITDPAEAVVQTLPAP